MKRFVARAAGVLALLLAAAAAPAGDQLYLWEAKGKGGSVHLFGSIHLCRADCFPLPEAVTSALDRAHFFALELDPAKPGLQEELLLRSFYADGDGLDRHLPGPLVQDLKETAARLGLPPDALLKMKPWMASTTLTMLSAMQAGYSADQGIDMQLLERARAQKKTVVELESVEQQVNSLDGLAAAEQELLVAQALRLAAGDGVTRYVDDMVQAWRGGDPEQLYRLSQSGLDDAAASERLLRSLLIERNRAMAQRIMRLMATQRPGFVVIGALHLAGSDSVLEQLKAAGFQVRQVAATRSAPAQK